VEVEVEVGPLFLHPVLAIASQTPTIWAAAVHNFTRRRRRDKGQPHLNFHPHAHAYAHVHAQHSFPFLLLFPVSQAAALHRARRSLHESAVSSCDGSPIGAQSKFLVKSRWKGFHQPQPPLSIKGMCTEKCLERTVTCSNRRNPHSKLLCLCCYLHPRPGEVRTPTYKLSSTLLDERSDSVT
jgi:hypothetical protein